MIELLNNLPSGRYIDCQYISKPCPLCAMLTPIMQEHNYTASNSKIFKQSFFIWLFVLLQIFINVDGAKTFISRGDEWAWLFTNLILAAINIPAIVLFIKYYKRSVGKEFIVTYNKLRFRDTASGKTIEINNSEIARIKLIQNVRMSRLPWCSHEYFKVIDMNGKEIIVTSYIMDISELWTDSLIRKISSSNLEREQKYYPLF